MGNSLLSILVFLPLAALLVLGFWPGGRGAKALPFISIGTAGLQLLISLYIWGSQFWGGAEGFAVQERFEWFTLRGDLGRPLLQVEYFLAADGLSVAMVVLSGLVLTLSAITALSLKVDRPRLYHGLFLLLCLAVPGCFLAQDAFLFYLFFELMLIPMYFLVGLFGGARREFAAIQFFLYTLFGSLLILAGFAILYLTDNPQGMLNALAKPDTEVGRWLLPLTGGLAGLPTAHWVFWLLFIGFAIKLPLVPLHTWLPPAHTEAPTPVSIILAGILLKTGGYGMLRWVWPLFPDQAAHYQTWVAIAGGVSVLYGALMALSSVDYKRMVAYSSISHMGFVVLGLAANSKVGYAGAAYQLFSHGIIAAGLFASAGWVEKRLGTRRLDSFSGLFGPLPKYTIVTCTLFFAGMGLPGFSGFVGEFMTLAAGFKSYGATDGIWGLILALLGLLVTSGFFLWALRRMFMGEVWLKNPPTEIPVADLSALEWAVMGVACALTVLFGLYSGPLMDLLGR